jgi:hypothetical protein
MSFHDRTLYHARRSFLFYLDIACHVRMKAAIIFNQSGFIQCNATDAMHRQQDVPLVIARRCRMDDESWFAHSTVSPTRAEISADENKSPLISTLKVSAVAGKTVAKRITATAPAPKMAGVLTSERRFI